MAGEAMFHGEEAERGETLSWPDHSILVVDDEQGMRSFLERALKSRFGMVEVAPDVEHAAQLMERLHFDVLVLDIALPGRSGMDWLGELREHGFAGEVILITAFADLDSAISALRAGASDFILKPFRLDQILNALKNCLQRNRLARENFMLRRELSVRGPRVEGLVGQSAVMQQLRTLLHRVAQTSSTVLLQGESGTGKEVAARALHSMSARAERAFVPVNCAAIASELIESELFGHVKGAFTGASEAHHGLFHYAHGGTLFLDEISELPLAMQTRLLRVLEERKLRPVGSSREVPVDVRIVAASNRDLRAEVKAGRFREDLYFRLAVVDVRIPPLRERAEDVPDLAAHFMGELSTRLGVAPLRMPQGLRARLIAHAWPGNVRELRNFIERSLILGGFALESLAAEPARDAESALATLMLPLEEVEKRHILAVLADCGGSKNEAAQRLGVSRKTLDRKCAEWNETTH